MEQMRVGTNVGTRKTPFHGWSVTDCKTINQAKAKNGLNSTTGDKFPAVLETRRVAERRQQSVQVKEEQRRFERRQIK